MSRLRCILRWNSFWLLCVMMPSAAQALAITNLSGVPQTVEIHDGDNFVPQLIAEGATLRLIGRYEVRMNDSIKTIERDEEYVIWPDGRLQPQKKRNNNSKGFQ